MAFDKKVYLSSPTMHGDEMVYIQDAYNTNWMSTVGENISTIESKISKQVGSRYAVAMATGTAAIHLAVKLAGIKRGMRVFCSDLTFTASVNPVVYEGAVPIFIGCEKDTWNMSPDALRKAFEKYPDVKHVILVNLFGTPGKIDEIRKICEEHDAVIIEDAAESFGSKYKGKSVGSFGKYGILSFNGNKIITGSSGGLLLTDVEADALKARKWSTQSRDDASWYQHSEIGYNYRMSNVVAGVIRGQLGYLKAHIEQKKNIYYRYKEGLKDLPVTMNPFDKSTSEPNFWLSCITINEDAMCKQKRGDTKAEFTAEHGKSCPTEIIEMLNRLNVESRPIWKPLHMQPVFSEFDYIGEKNDESIFDRGVCLPSDNKMTPEQQDKIIEYIKRCFD